MVQRIGYDGRVGEVKQRRLISRLRHRNFGVFVALSYFNSQVYDEVRADGHPIALVCGRDVVDALRSNGYGGVAGNEVSSHDCTAAEAEA
nr:restriction endonuclease [Mycobacterium sp. E735]